MANVDSEKPMLRGLTPPVLPQLAQRRDTHEAAAPGPDESASAAEAFPGELTPVVTVDQSMTFAADSGPWDRPPEDVTALAPKPTPAAAPSAIVPPEEAEADAQDVQAAGADPHAVDVEIPADASLQAAAAPDLSSAQLGSEDRTVISPTPIPPESEDHTNPTADAQILDTAPAHPTVPARAITLGMGHVTARPKAVSMKDRWLKLAQKPVALSGLQLAAVVGAAALMGSLLTVATWSPVAPAMPQSAASVAANPAGTGPTAAAKPRVAPPPPQTPRAVAAEAAPAEAAPALPEATTAAAKPLVRKKKPLKKFAKAARPGAPAKATR